jgi:maleylpyruvate isomerase
VSVLPPVDTLLGWVGDGQQRLEQAVAELPASAVPEPSALDGWSRGHVLAHLSRNADALVNLLSWARSGVRTPMYPSAEHRNADIEAGAGRGLAEQLTDLRDSARRFADATAAMSDRDWSAIVANAQGRELPAAEVPWMRVREVWIHLVDLRIGVSIEVLPAELAWTLAQEVADRMSGEVDVAVELTAPGHGSLSLGSAKPEGHLSGSPNELAAWLTGRAGPEILQGSGKIPTLPRWL